MITAIDEPGLTETDAAKQLLRGELESRKKEVQAANAQLGDVLNAIRAVAPNKPDAAEDARGKIGGLESLLDPVVVSAFREWVQDRQRPTEDRFDRLAAAIRARLSERVDGLAEASLSQMRQAKRGRNHSLARLDPGLSLERGTVTPWSIQIARQRCRLILEEQRRLEPKAASMAAAIEKDTKLQNSLGGSRRPEASAPTDEKKFTEVTR
jgi:hypothetical protein